MADASSHHAFFAMPYYPLKWCQNKSFSPRNCPWQIFFQCNWSNYTGKMPVSPRTINYISKSRLCLTMKIHTSPKSRENKGKRRKPLLFQKKICMSQHAQEMGENVSLGRAALRHPLWPRRCHAAPHLRGTCEFLCSWDSRHLSYECYPIDPPQPEESQHTFLSLCNTHSLDFQWRKGFYFSENLSWLLYFINTRKTSSDGNLLVL